VKEFESLKYCLTFIWKSRRADQFKEINLCSQVRKEKEKKKKKKLLHISLHFMEKKENRSVPKHL
jgi:hypothetical protein